MDKLKCFITPVAAAFMMTSMSVAQASDSSVTILPAEGNVQCNDYAANKIILSMDTRSAVYGVTVELTGPENPNDADNTGETVSYFITPDGTTLSFFDSTTPIDYAVLKSGQTVSVLMYEIGGIFGDSNMTIPGGISIDAFSLCYGLGNDPLNQAPVLDPIGNQSVTAGQTLTFDVTAFDTDGLPSGGAVTISITEDPLNPLPAGAGFVDNGDGTASFSWTTTDTDVGSYTVTFTASDGDLEDSETITIFVNPSTPSCEVLGEVSTLDDTGIVCPDTGRTLVCNIELDEPFYGLVASDSCCVCNNNSPLQECDADIPAGATNADGVPSCTLTPAEKTALGDLLRPAEVTTHIELNNDPYYCTTIGGRRTCYRY